ncbi:hypothetical protein YPPY54_1455, partial [Yersinia pestis PY-54]
MSLRSDNIFSFSA